MAVVPFFAACERQDAGSTRPTPPALTLLAAGSEAWTQETAAANLAEPEFAVSAAIRLVQLAKTETPLVPDPLTDADVRRLRVLAVGTARFALGATVVDEPTTLRHPIVFSVDGAVVPVEVDPNVALLRVSDEPTLFPNVVIGAERVIVLGENLAPGIVLEPNQPVTFGVRGSHTVPDLVLTCPAATDPNAVVARYEWDPYEQVFMGPAADALPDPPGGSFHVDLKASVGLIPKGGEIPEPQPLAPTTQEHESERLPESPIGGDDWLS